MSVQGRVRGWFPRQCAVERMEHEDSCMAGRQKEMKKVK